MVKEAKSAAKEEAAVSVFRSPFYGYTCTLWPEQRRLNNLTGSIDIVEGARVVRFTETDIGSEYRTSNPVEIERLRELAKGDPRGLYEFTGREFITPARKPGETYRGYGKRLPDGTIANAIPRGEVLKPGDMGT